MRRSGGGRSVVEVIGVADGVVGGNSGPGALVQGRPPLPSAQRRPMPPPSLKTPTFLAGGGSISGNGAGKSPTGPACGDGGERDTVAAAAAAATAAAAAAATRTRFLSQQREGGSGLKASISNSSVKQVLDSTESLSSEVSSIDGEAWRKHGKLYRANLIMEDEESGGNTFVLSSNCGIERYYQVAERVGPLLFNMLS